jgi:hypothetical protein
MSCPTSPKRHKLHGPADGPPRGLGLLPERGKELEREGPDGGHHHHLLLRGPPGRALQRYETAWTINPLLLEGSGYSEYKGYEGEVQALEDQARALEKISRDLQEAKEAMKYRREEQVG